MLDRIRKFLNNQAGQTMIEVVLILAVVAVALVAVTPDLIDKLDDTYAKSEGTISYNPEQGDYLVQYDANGGTGAPEPQIKYHDRDINLSIVKPVRSGYRFLGWNPDQTEATAGIINTQYDPGAVYAENRDITLYAAWEPNEFKITYDTNTPADVSDTALMDDGLGYMTPLREDIKHYNVDYIITRTQPVCAGYKFSSWNTRSDGTGITYRADDVYSINADLYLYAQWARNVYTVRYHNTYLTDGVTGTVPASETHQVNEQVYIKNATLQWQGYQFAGWVEYDPVVKNEEQTLVTHKAGASFSMPAHDVDLYAVRMPTEYPYNGTNGMNGDYQVFIAPVDGTYRLQVWGATGGESIEDGSVFMGARGGYSSCDIHLSKGQRIYIAVGGHGQDCGTAPTGSNITTYPGGYNGGGAGLSDLYLDEGSATSPLRDGGGGGGGCTSIAKNLIGDGVLTDYVSNKSYVMIVAGGGAGAESNNFQTGVGAGSSALTGQYSFGQGQDAPRQIIKK